MHQNKNVFWLALQKKGVITLCSLLILLGLTISSAFAYSATHASASTTDDLSDLRLQNVVTLGLAGPGGVVMTSEQTGWAYASNGLQHSSDGGRTWQAVTQNNDQQFIFHPHIFDGQTMWYEALDPQTFTMTALYRTNDGGQSWTRFDWISPTQFLNSISIFDQQGAWVTTSEFDGTQNIYHLYLVGENGQSFQEVALPGSKQPGDIHFISAQIGWVLDVNPDTSVETLQMTRDGGQNWTEQTLAQPAGVPATDTSGINFLGFGNANVGYLRVRFNDPTTGATDAEQIYATVDGGQSWRPYGEPMPADLHFISQIDIWHVTVSQPIFSSSVTSLDLGMLLPGKWQTQQVNLTGNGERLFTGLTSRVMFISAFSDDHNAQILYRTVNGGVAWQQIATLPYSI